MTFKQINAFDVSPWKKTSEKRIRVGRQAEILAIVVRFALPAAYSHTLQGLTCGFETNLGLDQSIAVLIWDNSPEPIADPSSFPAFTYHHSSENLGVAGAYNRALQLAESYSIPWLLLLDQDTTLSSGFLPKMLEYSRQFKQSPKIAAIAPILFNGEKVSSPSILRHGLSHAVAPDYCGSSDALVLPLNSGTLIRADAVRAIGGFDENFWLDFSDIALHTALFRSGKRVYVAGDLHLLHNTAIDDIEHAMSPQRYRNLLNAEGAYWDIYGSVPERALHLVRLLTRTTRQCLRFRNKTFSRLTSACLLDRLAHFRKYRVARWKRNPQIARIPLHGGTNVDTESTHISIRRQA